MSEARWHCLGTWMAVLLAFATYAVAEPRYVQPESSCAPATLKAFVMIRGRQITLRSASELLQTDAYGLTHVSAMQRGLNALGYNAVAAKVSFEQLGELPKPVILVFQYPGGMNHFALLAYSRPGKETVLWDIPNEPKKLSKKLLTDMGWKGAVIFDALDRNVVSTQRTDIPSTSGIVARGSVSVPPGQSEAHVPLENSTKERVFIKSVRATCGSCLDTQTPFSFPDSLEPGATGDITVRFRERAASSLNVLKLFIASPHPQIPLESVYIYSSQGPAFVTPATLDISTLDREEAAAPTKLFRIISFRRIDETDIRVQLLVPGNPPELLSHSALNVAREQKTGWFHILCAVGIRQAGLPRVTDKNSFVSLPGATNVGFAHLVIYIGEREIGRIRVLYSGAVQHR